MQNISEIFDTKLRKAFVNRALRRNDFNVQLKHEIEESLEFHLQTLPKSFENIAYISDFEFKIKGAVRLIEFDTSKKFEAVISVMQIHNVNDIFAIVNFAKAIVEKSGFLIFAFPGNRSFAEFREFFKMLEIKRLNGFAPRFLPMIDVKDAGRIMQNSGLKNVIVDVDEFHLQVDNINDFLKLTRGTGLGNCMIMRDQKFLGKDFLRDIEREIANYPNKAELFKIDWITVVAYNS